MDKKKERTIIKLDLSRLKIEIEDFINKTGITTTEEIGTAESMLNRYEKLLNSFNTITKTVILSFDDTHENYDAVVNSMLKELELFRSVIFTTEGKIKAAVKSLSAEQNRQSLLSSPSRSNQSIIHSNNTEPKLERIQVPTFDGNILNFPSFKGLYVNLIHNNESLTNVKKLYYLKQSLVGNARNMIRDFELNDDSYSEAWSYVLSRFDNRRSVLRSLFRKLHNLETIKTDQDIRKLLDEVNIIVRGLTASGETIDETFSRYITYHVSIRLDPETAKDWENSLTNSKSYPKFEELQKFLQTRAFAIEDRVAESTFKTNSYTKPNKTSSYYGRQQYYSKPNDKKSFSAVTSNLKCVVCTEAHFLNQCKTFTSKPPSERFDIVKKNRLCVRCFNPYHQVSDCKRPHCSMCKGNHHTLLHLTRENTSTVSTPVATSSNNAETRDTQTKVTMHSSTGNYKKVILSTAVVKIKVQNRFVLARVLLDTASEPTLVRGSWIKNAGVRTQSSEPVILQTVTDSNTVLDQIVNLSLQSRHTDFELSVVAEVVDKIPYSIADRVITKMIHDLPNLKFAECNLPYNEVDIVLSAEYYEFILENERQFVENLALRDTKFGVIISGSTTKTNNYLVTTTPFCGVNATRLDVNEQLKRFWEIEETEQNFDLHNSETIVEHKLIEEFFEKTYTQDNAGRFMVRLPVKQSISQLSGSPEKVIRSLINSEKRLTPVISEAYTNFMNEYIELGHMRVLSEQQIHEKPCNYINHHIVQKPTSTTTKYRVVFNCSMKDESGTSLNDHLMSGPVLQPELFDTLIRFRKYTVAFCADIEKMYRQIKVHPEDCRFQRIVWRSSPDKPIQHYELGTVTYGSGPSSYLATKCLQIAARKIESQLPRTAKVIENETYMDDIVTGSQTVEEAIKLQRSLHNALSEVGFPLRKYQSNSEEFLDHIDSTLVENSNSRSLCGDSIHILGVRWYTKEDELRVSLNLNPLPDVITKRVMLSNIARIFDIFGMLTPVTIRAKIMLQDIWREQLNWDEEVPYQLCSSFLKYHNELSELQQYSIPRNYCPFNNIVNRQLVGFCDSSKQAYCAIVYLRFTDNSNNNYINFVCSRSRVTPLKGQLTIPKLELLAAVLLTNLLKRISDVLDISKNDIFAFSDSTIVLGWLRRPANELKQFVSNRITKIVTVLPKNNWHYVSTSDNPADLATRGESVKKFINNRLWLNGPTWILNQFDNHINIELNFSKHLPEIRKPKVVFSNLIIATPLLTTLLTRISSYTKLIDVTAYMLRFINNCNSKLVTPHLFNCIASYNCNDVFINFNLETLSVTERETALNVLIMLSQRNYFSDDYQRLLDSKPIKNSSSLKYLVPFLDEHGLLRVRGRIKNSYLPYEKCHPIILTAKCKFIYLLVKHLHEKYFHCSKAIIYTYLQNKYWIVYGINNIIKRIIKECIFCTRLRAVTGSQLMAQLPATRLTATRPFYNVGVDFAGYFLTKCLGHRSAKINKSYIAFFVCFSTRAVHLEIVSDLTTDKFLDALRRFIARRGLPRSIYSDNGKNMVGASNALYSNRQQLNNWATNEGIQWNFITPRAPHQGGLWESAVKAGKGLLLKATKNQTLTFEGLNTVSCQIESILNSRPLCYRWSADKTAEVITPAHFLVGDNLLILPVDRNDSQLSLEKKFNNIQNIVRSYWNEWRKSYINSLQIRNKWTKEEPNFRVNDVVIIKEDNVHLLEWPIAKITEVMVDKEGLVRNVRLKAKNGSYVRPVNKLVKLLHSDEELISRGE